jgi:hypothetical protein
MNQPTSDEQRIIFQNWLRDQLKALDFYIKRTDSYLVREFHRYTVEHGHPIDEASLGRYINRGQAFEGRPVVPTPDTCRDLAAVLGIPAIEVMKQAGLVREEDFKKPA